MFLYDIVFNAFFYVKNPCPALHQYPWYAPAASVSHLGMIALDEVLKVQMLICSISYLHYLILIYTLACL